MVYFSALNLFLCTGDKTFELLVHLTPSTPESNYSTRFCALISACTCAKYSCALFNFMVQSTLSVYLMHHFLKFGRPVITICRYCFEYMYVPGLGSVCSAIQFHTGFTLPFTCLLISSTPTDDLFDRFLFDKILLIGLGEAAVRHQSHMCYLLLAYLQLASPPFIYLSIYAFRIGEKLHKCEFGLSPIHMIFNLQLWKLFLCMFFLCGCQDFLHFAIINNIQG